MDELLNLNRSKSAGRVKGNIDRFETLSVAESTGEKQPDSSKWKRSILDITPSVTSDVSSLKAPSDLTSSESSRSTSAAIEPATKKHKKHESVAFLQKSYLRPDNKTEQDTLPDDAREILKSHPDYDDLIAVLQYLECGIHAKHDFNIHITGPKASQIINALVTVTIPDHWSLVRAGKLSKRDARLRRLLVLILRSVAGIGALLMQIRKLSTIKANDNAILEDVVSALQTVVNSNQFIKIMLQDARKLYPKESSRRLNWQEVVSLIAGSKILAFTSQGMLMGGLAAHKFRWLSEGEEYCKWLAKTISAAAIDLGPEDTEGWTMLTQVVKRALNLGYRDVLVSEIYHSFLLGRLALWTPLRQILHHLSDHEQRLFFDAVLRDLARRYISTPLVAHEPAKATETTKSGIEGVAAMVAGMAQNNSVLEEHIVQWLTSTSGEYSGLGLNVRRAVIATLASHQDKLRRVLEKCLENFGDKLQIQHSPILQQESTAEVILLSIGYLNRIQPESVVQQSKTGLFLRTVSNRLSASVPRARFLGMIVATAVSRLVDPPDKVMEFGTDELEGEEAQRLFGLVKIEDTVGSLDNLRDTNAPTGPIVIDLPPPNPKPKKTAQTQQSRIISIEEIEDESEESEDDDLVPYQKPDDDPSDEDDDPTLINRNKPTAPVYIIDLIKQLQLDEKPDTVDLALSTAPSLIRRKANFGTELSDNVQVLATTLLNLKSPPLDSNTSHKHRLDALIASTVSHPSIIAPWLCSTYFAGDYSLAQRATILSTLGLSARELGGLDLPPSSSSSSSSSFSSSSSPAATNDNTSDDTAATTFTSSRLPAHLSPLFTPTSTLATQLTTTALQPLTHAAADKLSGPDILKIRTFSSRLAVQKKNEAAAKERTRRVPRDLHRLLSRDFYLPLCARFELVLSSAARSGLGRSNVFDPSIVRLLLQTLVVVLYALGPNAIEFGDVGRETLGMLSVLSRVSVVYDPLVLPVGLQLLLGVVEMCVEQGRGGEERLVGDWGEMMAGLVRWVRGLEGLQVPEVDVKGQGKEGLGWRLLAAGVLVRWGEVGQRWQGRVMGVMGVDG